MRAATWSSGALIVGTVAVVDPSGLAPFGPSKWAAISTLGLLTSGLALWTGRHPLHRRTLLASVGLLTFLMLGALFGGDVPTALLGQPDRHLGLVTWLLFVLLFCAGQQLIDDVDRAFIARAAVVATALLGLWAAWELAFGPPTDIGSNTQRLTGPFGSAAYLGAASCLLLPVAVGVALDRSAGRTWRAAAVLSTALGTLALLGSGARAALLAAALVGLAIVVVARPPRRALISGGLVLLVAVACLAPRLSDVFDRSDGAGSRLDEWAVATRVIAAHPLIGVGPEGYRIAVSEGIDRHYERTYGRNIVLPDRAHSGPLDVALDGGIPAAVLYLSIVGFVCWRALGLIRTRNRAMVGIAAGVIAYSLQQLLLFPLAELDPVWWLLAGMVVAAGPVTSTVAAHRRATAAVALTLVPLAVIGGVLDIAADRLAADALAEPSSSIAIDTAERAVALRPDEVRYRMVAAELLARRGTLADIDAAIGQCDHALDWSSDDPIAADRHADLLLQRASITGAVADVTRALDTWQSLVDRDPVRARWQLQLGRAAALAGDTDRARRAWSTAADLDPDDHTAADLLDALGAASESP